MHFPVEGSRKTLLFFTVLTSWAIGFGETAGDKTLNLRIGFDLTQGKNGAPALRIRNFEDSVENDRYPRAAENEGMSKETGNGSPAIRADSFSESKEDKPGGRNEDSSREANSQSNGDSDDDDSDGKRTHKSTKGIYPEEYEPEENAKVHGRFNEDDDDDSDANGQRRHKRQIKYESGKRKSKKVLGFRKRWITRA